ncbi:MAG: hypothetical protein R3A79_03355 [Nannocystaceae bacterium]
MTRIEAQLEPPDLRAEAPREPARSDAGPDRPGSAGGRAGDPADPLAPSPLAELEGYALRYADAERRLDLHAPDGRLCVRLTLGEAGPQIEVLGASLAIRAERELTLACEQLEIDAEAGIRVRSRGDLELFADGALRTEAFEQRLVARRGDLSLEANDDVAVEGERILLNSPKPIVRG